MRWAELHAAIDGNKTPVLGRLVEGGLSGQLDTGALGGAPFWASVATGRDPSGHRLFGSGQTRSDGGGVEPVGAASWGAPAFWQVLHAAGLRTAVICWPGVTPADSWPELMVDDRFAAVMARSPEDWPLAPRCVHPAGLRQALRDLRVHPSDLDEQTLARFGSGRWEQVALAVAETATIHAAAVHVAGRPDWDALAVRYPIMERLPTEGSLAFLDAAIGRIMTVAGEQLRVCIVSDRGVFILAGDGVESDALAHDLDLLDVAPIMLALFGVRLAETSGLRPARLRLSPDADLQAIEPPAAPGAGRKRPAVDDEAPAVTDRLRVRNLASEAAALVASGAFTDAVPILRELLSGDPDDPNALFLLGQCCFFLSDRAECLSIGRRLDAVSPDAPWGPMLVGAALALEGRSKEAQQELARAAARSLGDAQAQVRLGAIYLRMFQLEPAEAHYRAALGLSADLPEAHAGLALARLGVQDVVGAETHLRRSLALRFAAPALHQVLGELLMATGRVDEASGWLRSAAELREAGRDRTSAQLSGAPA